jgi:hypothetical protein
MNVHVFRAPNQPATRYFIAFGSHRSWVRIQRRALVHCLKCSRRRWAQNCVVQVYYDSVRYFCRPGKGCEVAT